MKTDWPAWRAKWNALSFYEKFEQVVVLVLTGVIAVVIVSALWHLILRVALGLVLAFADPSNGPWPPGREAFCYWVPTLADPYARADWTALRVYNTLNWTRTDPVRAVIEFPLGEPSRGNPARDDSRAPTGFRLRNAAGEEVPFAVTHVETVVRQVLNPRELPLDQWVRRVTIEFVLLTVPTGIVLGLLLDLVVDCRKRFGEFVDRRAGGLIAHHHIAPGRDLVAAHFVAAELIAADFVAADLIAVNSGRNLISPDHIAGDVDAATAKFDAALIVGSHDRLLRGMSATYRSQTVLSSAGEISPPEQS